LSVISCIFAEKLGEENPNNQNFKNGFLFLFYPPDAHEKRNGRDFSSCPIDDNCHATFSISRSCVSCPS
jgi:hypothetical protein